MLKAYSVYNRQVINRLSSLGGVVCGQPEPRWSCLFGQGHPRCFVVLTPGCLRQLRSVTSREWGSSPVSFFCT